MKSLLEERMADLIMRVETCWIPTVTDFLTRPELKKIESQLQAAAVQWSFWGGYEEAERGRIAMKMEETPFLFDEYGMTLLALRGQMKYTKAGHRDYLGALMSLGFEREKMGDIIVREDGCDLFIVNEMVDYIRYAGISVRRVPLIATVLDPSAWQAPTANYKEKHIFVASLRLDAVLAQGFGLSRKEASEALAQGSVLLSYVETSNPHAQVVMDDIITLRGKGKLRIGAIGGQSKKGRLAVTVYIYQ